MAGNDNERTFVPAEIDVLEDALEQAPSSVLSLPSTLDDDARTRIHAALVRYRAIERHAQALLYVEPPASVLAAVMAEARAAAAVPSVQPEPAVESAPSVWSRIKALWIVPSLAAVGVTALVLVMVTRTPDDARSSSADAPPRVAAAEREVDAKSEAMPPLAQADGRANNDALDDERQRGAGLVDDVTARVADEPSESAEVTSRLEESSRAEKRRSANAEPPSDPAPIVDPFAAAEPKPKPKATTSSTPKAPPQPAKPSSGAGGNAPGGVPTPTTPSAGPQAPKADADKPDGSEKEAPSAQERLSRADAARRGGNCSAARPDYDRVVEIGTSKQRARARAGIALCLERSGDTAGARSLIDRARQDDAQIDAWVDAER